MYRLFEHYLAGERAYMTCLAPVWEKHGLTYMELTVLLFLANNPALDTASDIVRCRRLAKSHVSVSIRSLEQRGLLTRDYQAGNRRSQHLRLTGKAAPIAAEGQAAQMEFGERLFRGISPEERETLVRILRHIDENIDTYASSNGKAANHAG